MSLKTVSYGILSFPCSRHGIPVPPNTFSANTLLTSCGVADLARLRRPANKEIRYLWMSRFVNGMHWLPLVETLIGCDRLANPKEHSAFVAALKAANPLRVCHRPWGQSEARTWVYKLTQRIKTLCPDPRIHGLVQQRLSEVGKGGDVFFVSNDCEPAATQSQTTRQIWETTSWVLYRHTLMGSRPLTDEENQSFVLGTSDPTDVAAHAYKKLLSVSP
jgi:hypothetical protein